jgi:hypothetical protein
MQALTRCPQAHTPRTIEGSGIANELFAELERACFIKAK